MESNYISLQLEKLEEIVWLGDFGVSIRKSGMKEFKNLDVQMFVESIGKLIGG